MGEDYKKILLQIEGAENYKNLIIANREVLDAHKVHFLVEGNEDYQAGLQKAGEVGVVIGTNILSASKWLGGKTLNLINQALKKSNTQLQLNFANNGTMIKKTSTDLDKNNVKDDFDVSAGDLANLTSTGRVKDLQDDLKTTLHMMDILKHHTKDVNGYLEKTISIIRKLSSIKDDRTALDVYDEYHALQYPKLTFPNKPESDMFVSDVLPGGKVMKFKYDPSKNIIEYSMSGDKPSGVSDTLQLDKGELKAFINELNPLNDVHKVLIDANNRYLKFSANWADAVKNAYKRIDSLDNLSSAVKKDLDKMLNGNGHSLVFYSGFTPRVSTYIDKYIHDVLVLANKVI